MPLREPRMEEDLQVASELLGLGVTTMASIYRLISGLNEVIQMNDVYIYNRGYVDLEDTSRRTRTCIMMSIWSEPIESDVAECIFQQPIPIRMRLEL